MTVAEEYRVKALRLRAEAIGSLNRARKRELYALANAYLRLAEQAERNSLNDVSYETPAPGGEDRQE